MKQDKATKFQLAALASAVLILTSVVGPAFSQSTYPTKPIRWVAPFSPGAFSDMVTRLVASGMEAELGQSIAVENVPGASGTIAATDVIKGNADGYTVLTVSSSNTTLAATLRQDLPYDPAKDLAYIGPIATSPWLLLGRPDLPASNIEELIALAKKEPGELNYGSPGVGSVPHILCESLKTETGMEIAHVPYQGGALALNDLVAGATDIQCADYVSAQGLVTGGKVKVLAAMVNERIPLLPDVPTLAEGGVTGFDTLLWVGAAVPVQTPADVRAALSKALDASLKRQEVVSAMTKVGASPGTGTSEAFTQMIANEQGVYRKVIEKAGLLKKN